jgi:hypothetical protein
MVEFDAEVTDPPSIDTSDPAGTAMSWAGYALVAGMAFVTLGVASNTVAPLIGDLLAAVGLSSGEESSSGGVSIDIAGDA